MCGKTTAPAYLPVLQCRKGDQLQPPSIVSARLHCANRPQLAQRALYLSKNSGSKCLFLQASAIGFTTLLSRRFTAASAAKKERVKALSAGRGCVKKIQRKKAASRWESGFSSPEVEKSVKALDNVNASNPIAAAKRPDANSRTSIKTATNERNVQWEVSPEALHAI